MCRNHDIEYLQDAENKLKTKLMEKADLLESKKQEVQDSLAEHHAFRRLRAVATEKKVQEISREKDQHLTKFENAAKKEEKQQQEITDKLTRDTTELFQTDMQLKQAIGELNRLKQSEDVHMVSRRFADLVENADNLSQIETKKLDEDEKVKLGIGNLSAEVVEEDGIYKIKGKNILRIYIWQDLVAGVKIGRALGPMAREFGCKPSKLTLGTIYWAHQYILQRNHNQTFKHKSLSHSTELSKYLWTHKERNEKYTLEWSIIQKATPYNPSKYIKYKQITQRHDMSL